MGAEPGRRSLKMPAEKLGPVIVEIKNLQTRFDKVRSWFLAKPEL